jgi:hypothetical protein
MVATRSGSFTTLAWSNETEIGSAAATGKAAAIVAAQIMRAKAAPPGIRVILRGAGTISRSLLGPSPSDVLELTRQFAGGLVKELQTAAQHDGGFDRSNFLAGGMTRVVLEAWLMGGPCNQYIRAL